MNSISLTIPLEYDALTRASDMLHGMATDLINKTKGVQGKGSKFTDQEIFDKFHAEGECETPIETVTDGIPTPSQLQAVNKALTETDELPPLIEASNKALTETTTNTGGVELDASGLPHDLRIHGAKRLKTTKDQMWKKIRNVNPALVATVEAELRAAMAASPDRPIEPAATQEALTLATPPAPTPPAPAQEPPAPETKDPVLYMVNGDQFTADQLRTAGWNDEQIAACEVVQEVKAITFPEFMAKLNPALAAGTVTQPIVDAALNKAGLASLPLLSARPDLIPGVMAELF